MAIEVAMAFGSVVETIGEIEAWCGDDQDAKHDKLCVYYSSLV